jgi:hypothetical protein
MIFSIVQGRAIRSVSSGNEAPTSLKQTRSNDVSAWVYLAGKDSLCVLIL